MRGTSTTESVSTSPTPGAQPAIGAKRRWLALPRPEVAARLMLFALVVALQNALEFPRGGITQALGTKLTSLLVVAVLGGSLALLLVALRPHVPQWGWLRSRRVQLLVLLVTLAACPTGLHQVGASLVAGFQPPVYPNDGTTLDHYAAQQLLEGHNPYVTTDIVAASRLYGQSADHTTPLRCGAFASIPVDGYPTKQQLTDVFARAEAELPQHACEFESHVSYPALAFLPLVPLVWAGLPSVVPFFTLCFLALTLLLLLSVPMELRLWLGLLVLADAPLLDATVGGVLDVFYILLLFVAWRWWRRPVLSTVFLGLALAAKQLAWFFVPFYALLVWRAYGWREAAKRLVGAGAIFLAINAPFIVNNPHAWLSGVLAPEVDPMFAMGNGLIRLSVSGILPLAPAAVYTLIEGLAMLACIAWYWRRGARMPEAGFVLAVVPLFFASRSLTTYFYFVALPVVALIFARQWQSGMLAELSGRAAPVVPSLQRQRRGRQRTLPRSKRRR